MDRVGKGSFGSVFEAIDYSDSNKSVICKINKYEEMNQLEGNVLKKLNYLGSSRFPKLLSIGMKQD